jgi:hypothetical protein
MTVGAMVFGFTGWILAGVTGGLADSPGTVWMPRGRHCGVDATGGCSHPDVSPSLDGKPFARAIRL